MSDPETGIGSWSEADVKRALTEGARPERRAVGAADAGCLLQDLNAPRDLDAVAAYVKTAAPVRNQVPPPVYKAAMHAELIPNAESDRACVPGLEQFLDRAARPNRSRRGGRGRQHAPTRHNHRR